MRSQNMIVLTGQVKEEYPGTVVYGIGDEAHKRSASGHNEDDTPGSRPEQEDPDTKPEHRAIDIMLGRTFTYAVAWAFVAAMVSLKVNQDRLLYVIFDGWIWRRNGGWRKEIYSGSDKHRDHVHVSGNWPDDDNTARWVTRIPAPLNPSTDAPTVDATTNQGDDMLLIYGAPTGEGSRWAVVMGDVWTEYVTQEQGNGASAGAGRSFGQVSPAAYVQMRKPFADAGKVRVAPSS